MGGSMVTSSTPCLRHKQFYLLSTNSIYVSASASQHVPFLISHKPLIVKPKILLRQRRSLSQWERDKTIPQNNNSTAHRTRFTIKIFFFYFLAMLWKTTRTTPSKSIRSPFNRYIFQREQRWTTAGEIARGPSDVSRIHSSAPAYDEFSRVCWFSARRKTQSGEWSEHFRSPR